MYKVITIDPRPAQKDAMVELLKANAPVVGIEFTLPALTEYIESNIDGQHAADASNQAACELALDVDLPAENATLAIVRADADALASAAILNLRHDGVVFIGDIAERVEYIAEHDKFEHGPWPGPRPLGQDYVSEDLEFAALSLLALDFKTPIEERVLRFEQWLATGNATGLEDAKERVIGSRSTALEQTAFWLNGAGIAILESHHQGATALGYRKAPILVIKNDAFRFAGGEPHTKFTICQYQAVYVDLKAIIADLNAAEKSGGTWGGSATIAGSPQGVSSSLLMKEVVAIVEKHLL